MAFFVLLEAGGLPTFMTDGEGDEPAQFDTAVEATCAAGSNALGRAFGFVVIEVPNGLIQMTRVVE